MCIKKIIQKFRKKQEKELIYLYLDEINDNFNSSIERIEIEKINGKYTQLILHYNKLCISSKVNDKMYHIETRPVNPVLKITTEIDKQFVESLIENYHKNQYIIEKWKE